MMVSELRDILEITGSRNFGWADLPSVGASGDAESALEGAFTLTVECSSKEDLFTWFTTGVYGPTRTWFRS
ncbi:hypothetical protein BVC80_517g3 [Macleaya cordata]|uniref:Uncharacterized protein n=1 Tax=Macleaya cordata TaxID=56857 RepID=A0A200PYI8_MACCD|nr:hypothetical protein BVC80_517g3 [Macleaya cordata]